jgi:hypothetical protein
MSWGRASVRASGTVARKPPHHNRTFDEACNRWRSGRAASSKPCTMLMRAASVSANLASTGL